MRSNYQRALRYAMKCCPPLYKDITHTAYIRHFNKHGTNLFDQPIYTVLRYVKNVWFNELRDRMYMKGGQLYPRHFYTASEEWTDEPGSAMLPSNSALPDSHVITKEFYQELHKRVDGYNSGHRTGCSVDTKILRQFLHYVEVGYTYPEISKEMGMSAQRIHYYKKKLQKIITDMEINNPFHGNRAKISKKVSRKVYEEKYKDEYIYDPKKGDWCDFNETAQILVHKDREEYILVKEKTD